MKSIDENLTDVNEKLSTEEETMKEEEPKKGKESKTRHVLNIVVAFALFIVIGALAIILPKPTESEFERRELTKLPPFSLKAYMTSDYNAGVESFYADTFPFRDSLVRFRAVLEEIRGVHSDDVKLHGTAPTVTQDDIPDVTEPAEKPTPPKPPVQSDTPPKGETPSSEPPKVTPPEEPTPEMTPTPEETPTPPTDSEEGEMVNSVFVYKDMAMELFGGTKAAAEYYASVVNEYRNAFGSNVNVYSVLIPTHVEFALPDKYKGLTNSEKKNMDYIWSLLDGGVIKVDAYGKLAQHSDEYIYFKTDHHWTGLGAYYAYTAFAESAGVSPYAYDSYNKHRIEPFIGTLYGVTGQDPRLLNAGDYVEWCDIPVSHKAYHYKNNDPYTAYDIGSVMASYATGGNSYSVYLHGDYPLTIAETNVANGRRALIIKESYGNAFSTYLVPHFEKTYIVDERYFELNLQDFVRDNGITDIVIVNNCFAANTYFHIENIRSLLYQQSPSLEEINNRKAAAAVPATTEEEEKDENENKIKVTG